MPTLNQSTTPTRRKPTPKQREGRKRKEQRDSQESTLKRKVGTVNMVGGAVLEWQGSISCTVL